MPSTQAVGIDLGTSYSCIAHLNEHGEPITIPNADGELTTPSVVLFEGDQVIVGTEALRNAIRSPDRTVSNSKRFIGTPDHHWKIQGRTYTPEDISTYILKELLRNAREKLGSVDQAVITVPAQFSDRQRQIVAEAGRRAGLQQVDIINEPVAAALCFVLGLEGAWFAELANEQTILVVDLGGGTYDLSLVRYKKNEVTVLASGGDLQLGGIDWNQRLTAALARQFQLEFHSNPAESRESLQALVNEIEQAKRSLSVRPKTSVTIQHDGHRKSYQVEVEQFERLTKPLVDRAEKLTLDLLKENKMGWAKVDVVLTAGGASRMPMIRAMLKRLSGRTLNTSLSPDLSIAHGATYYAGMLISNREAAQSILSPAAAQRLALVKHRSANARPLGILIRDRETHLPVPYQLIAPNSPLPAAAKHVFGTVRAGQQRVHLRVIEGGTSADTKYIELGTCLIEGLPADLPENSEIEVELSYNEQARVQVSACVLATGQRAQAQIVRPENLVDLSENAAQESSDTAFVPAKDAAPLQEIAIKSDIPVKKVEMPNDLFDSLFTDESRPMSIVGSKPDAAVPKKKLESSRQQDAAQSQKPSKSKNRQNPSLPPLPELDDSNTPVPLCDVCGDLLDRNGDCPRCRQRGREGQPRSAGKSPRR